MSYDIDPQDIDPDTGRPYAGYSSPALDTSFHDAEMDVDEPPELPLNYATKRLRAAAEASLAAWEDEEQSVRNEHRELIGELEAAIHYFNAHGATQAVQS